MILIAAPYPTNANEGSLQRILEIDSLFGDSPRVYLTETARIENWGFKKIKDNIYSLVIPMDFIRSDDFFSFIKQQISLVYCHSVFNYRLLSELYQRHDNLPPLYFDIHGVVPEEMTYIGEDQKAQIYGELERLAIQSAYCLIFVSHRMGEHFKNKYKISEFRNYVLPTSIFQKVEFSNFELRAKIDSYLDQIKFIYAGGTQRWQRCDLVMEWVKAKMTPKMKVDIFSPDIRYFEAIQSRAGVQVQQGRHDEVMKALKGAHYSFILRDLHILNQVSSPTKLSEALACGVVPVLLSPEVGDALVMKIQYLKYDDLVSGKLPAAQEYGAMAEYNLKIWNEALNIARRSVDQMIREMQNVAKKAQSAFDLTSQIEKYRTQFVFAQVRGIIGIGPRSIYRLIRYFLVRLTDFQKS